MTPHHFLIKPEHPYSLIVDLKGETKPLGVTMSLDLGTVINRMEQELICIGSGEIFGGTRTYDSEEIRAYIVRENDLETVKTILKKWAQKQPILKDKEEITLKGLIGTKKHESLLHQYENGDISISVLSKEEEIWVKFIKKNIKYIRGLNFNRPKDMEGISVYLHGLALFTESKGWEIQGRVMITVED